MVFETLVVKKPKRTPGAGLVLGGGFPDFSPSGGLQVKLIPDVDGLRAPGATIPLASDPCHLMWGRHVCCGYLGSRFALSLSDWVSLGQLLGL